MMLDIRNLAAAYGMHRALAGVSITVAKGEIVVILGANGAGKSTLLRAVAGMCEGQVQGDVYLDSTPITGVAPDLIVEQGIAFVPEGRGIFGEMTVAENLALGAYSKHARARQAENLARVYELFPKLRERRSQMARTMSGGEQQMVAIGRAMMADPKILMLDEPSLGLSPLLCKELFQNLAKISKTGLGVLLVEQNAKQSLAIADRGYLLENGEITGQDDAKALLTNPAVQAAYLGGAGGSRKPASRTGSDTAPAATTKSFVQPRGSSGAKASTDRLAGEAISALVARASSTPRPAAQVQQVKQTKPIHPAPSISPRPDPAHYRVSDDPEIKHLLDTMESAAKSARSGSSGISSGYPKHTGNRPQAHPNHVSETLPEIEIYRKNPLEIYRRDEFGNLVKVEK
ncbi:ABC transporter ATP-binding protein [Roseibium algae]|uniref:ABC transporter ATP-binding protein n=1 Tax=Roseibium algae TaxID=3123038 RepID=A0ABU8TGI0_9HYPH